jgi:hypothetical protein
MLKDDFKESDIVFGYKPKKGEGKFVNPPKHRPFVTDDSLNPDGIRLVVVKDVAEVLRHHFTNDTWFKNDDAEKLTTQENLVYLWEVLQHLNSPIKVTQAVLDAMEKVPEAKFILLEGNTRYFLKWDSDRSLFHIMASVPVSIGDYVEADCPLALQVLLGFTTKGVPVNEHTKLLFY